MLKVKIRMSFLNGQKKIMVNQPEPKWNFHKILINKDGKVEDTFASFTKPLSKKLIKAIENIL
jgi:glutathione peroxidase-family protein